MATIEHSALTTGELHEPKGIATADANTVYVADGVGSGAWRISPNAFCNYVSATGTTIVAPTTFTLINPTTSTTGTLREFSHNSAGRLTYTGTNPMTFRVHAQLGFQHTGGGSGVVDIIVFKNSLPIGVPCSTTASGSNGVSHLSGLNQFDLVTNDYVEVYVQASSGDVVIESFVLSAEGII